MRSSSVAAAMADADAQSTAAARRPPYRAAAVVAGLVLAGYVFTLAPTVTFWDAGEFTAAGKTLGIPHPPGTPLFVLLMHVWALAVPIGEYAFRTNLLSAVCSAVSAGLIFLLAHHVFLRSRTTVPPWLALAGPAAAAVAGAFTFTHWQNSNETEVYAVSTLMIAAMLWLAVLWRRDRGTVRSSRWLLGIVYLAGLSIGTHLLVLLAVPGIVLFLGITLRDAPAIASQARRREWAEVGLVAGVWALLGGTGLGSTTLSVVGSVAFLGALLFAAFAGAVGFGLLVLGLAAVGVSPYLFLYLRAAQHPLINEADPATFDALLAVLRRAQYPVRTPLDDPTVAHGPGNPGRSPFMLAVQLADYAVYFSWQWARGIGSGIVQVLVALGAFAVGLRGLWAHRRADRASWWMMLGVFLVTGIGLVAYMNFKPGAERWFAFFPDAEQHEVRERDYFFVASFIVWGFWVGLGCAAFAASFLRTVARPDASRRGGVRSRVWAAGAPALVLLGAAPFVLNGPSASRRHGADARLAADLAYDLLNSVPPYGVLFTYGDNDTFPLWWAQEVEGVRRDVTVVCLALANTEWYMRQLREMPVRPLDAAALPAVWHDRMGPPPDGPLHTMDDRAIATALGGILIRQPTRFAVGPIERVLIPGTYLYPSDIVALSIVQTNIGRRPIVWSVTTPHDFAGLGRYVVQRGLGFELLLERPDSVLPAGALSARPGEPPLDIPLTERLVWETYRYGHLLDRDVSRLDGTSAAFASTLAWPFTQLAAVYHERGSTAQRDRAAERATRLTPDPRMRAALAALRDTGY